MPFTDGIAERAPLIQGGVPSRERHPIRALVRAFGPADRVVQIEGYEPAVPGPGEVRVRMLAAAINPSDLVTISGAYAHRTPLPFVPGFEGVGIVDAVGVGVAEPAIGDRVLPIGSAGAWQSAKIAQSRWCFRVPSDLSDNQAATSYINPLTAWLMLHDRATVTAETRLVLNAAGSAIGRMLIRMANQVGIRPIAIVRSERSRVLLEGLNLDSVIVTDRDNPADSLRHQRPIDLALDAVGGPEGECLAMALRPGGHLIHYGLLSGVPVSAEIGLRRPDVTIEYFWLRRWIHEATRDMIAARHNHVAGLIRDGVAETRIEARYPLEKLPEAIRHSTCYGRSGKILVRL